MQPTKHSPHLGRNLKHLPKLCIGRHSNVPSEQ